MTSLRLFFATRVVCQLAVVIVTASIWASPSSGQGRPAQGQSPKQSPQPSQSPGGSGLGAPMGGTLVVVVCDEMGGTLNQMAMVTLRMQTGPTLRTTTTSSGRAEFTRVEAGEYDVEVEASGFQKLEQRIVFTGFDQQQFWLRLTPDVAPASAAVPNGPPILAPKAQKELAQGLEGLRSGKLDDARKHLMAAARLAPNHPDVNYLLGLLAAQTGNGVQANQYWETAISIYPKHIFALTALGETSLSTGNLQEAREKFEQAVKVDANFWRAHQLLALVLLKQQAYAESVQEAEKALELGKSKANGARLVLAEALARQQNRMRAIKVLQDLLNANPTEQQARYAQQALKTLQSPPGEPTGEATAVHADPSATPALVGLTASNAFAPAVARPTMELPRWIPANVDDSIPPADSVAACPLHQIIEQAGQRVLEFTHAVERFTATETLEHEVLNEWGLASRSERRSFNYVVFISEVRPGILDVEEYRNGSTSLDVFPDRIATLGMSSVVLVFHPFYVGDYDLTCEGHSHQRGQDAWQIHFRQRADRPARLRRFRSGDHSFAVGLKGRAWISAKTFHVLRMETDLINEIPDIRLVADHQTINYGPVPFQRRNVTLWLPFDTDLYLDLKGHRMHRRHSFSNYLLFSVDDRQEIQSPNEQTASTKSSEL